MKMKMREDKIQKLEQTHTIDYDDHLNSLIEEIKLLKQDNHQLRNSEINPKIQKLVGELKETQSENKRLQSELVTKIGAKDGSNPLNSLSQTVNDQTILIDQLNQYLNSKGGVKAYDELEKVVKNTQKQHKLAMDNEDKYKKMLEEAQIQLDGLLERNVVLEEDNLRITRELCKANVELQTYERVEKEAEKLRLLSNQQREMLDEMDVVLKQMKETENAQVLSINQWEQKEMEWIQKEKELDQRIQNQEQQENQWILKQSQWEEDLKQSNQIQKEKDIQIQSFLQKEQNWIDDQFKQSEKQQFLEEKCQDYANKEQIWTEKEQEWTKINQEWEKKEQEWADNQIAWGEKEQAWAKKVLEWEERVQSLAENEKVWTEKEKQWTEKDEAWAMKEKVWADKSMDWEEKEQQWAEKEQDWVKKVQEWENKEMIWAERDQVWSKKESEWEQKVQVWSEKEKDWECKELAWTDKENGWVVKYQDWEKKLQQWTEKEEAWVVREQILVDKDRAWAEKDKDWEKKETVWSNKEKDWLNKEQDWLGREQDWVQKKQEWASKEQDWAEKEKEWGEKEKEWIQMQGDMQQTMMKQLGNEEKMEMIQKQKDREWIEKEKSWQEIEREWLDKQKEWESKMMEKEQEMEQINKRMQQMKDSLDLKEKIVDQKDEIIAQKNEEIHTIKQYFTQSITQLEKQSQDLLKEKQELRLKVDELQEAVQEQTSVNQAIHAQIAHINLSKKEVEVSTDTKIKQLLKDIEEKENLYQKEIKEREKERLRLAEQHLKELDERDKDNLRQTEQHLKEIDQRYKEHVKELETKDNKHFKEMQIKDLELDRVNDKWEKQIIEMETKMKQQIDYLHQQLAIQLDSQRIEGDQVLSNYQQQLTSQTSQYQESIQNIKRDSDKMKEEYETKVDELKKELANKDSQIQTLQNDNLQLSSQINEMNQQLKSGMEEERDKVVAQTIKADQLQTHLDSLLQQHQRYSTLLSDLVASFYSNIDQIKSHAPSHTDLDKLTSQKPAIKQAICLSLSLLSEVHSPQTQTASHDEAKLIELRLLLSQAVCELSKLYEKLVLVEKHKSKTLSLTVKDLQKSIQHQTHSSATIPKEVEVLKEELERMREERKDLVEELERYKTVQEESDQMIYHLKDIHSKTLSDLKTKSASLNEQTLKIQKMSQNLDEQQKGLRDQHQLYEVRVQSQEQEIEQHQLRYRELEERFKIETADLNTQIQDLCFQLKKQLGRMEVLKKERDEANKFADQWQIEVETKRREYQAVVQMAEKEKRDNQRYQQKIQNLQEEIQDTVKTLKQFSELNQDLIAENERLNQEIELLGSHANPSQKIQLHLKTKNQNNKLREDNLILQQKVRHQTDQIAFLKQEATKGKLKESDQDMRSEGRARKDLDQLINHIISCHHIGRLTEQKQSDERQSLSIFQTMELVTMADDLIDDLKAKLEEQKLQNLQSKTMLKKAEKQLKNQASTSAIPPKVPVGSSSTKSGVSQQKLQCFDNEKDQVRGFLTNDIPQMQVPQIPQSHSLRNLHSQENSSAFKRQNVETQKPKGVEIEEEDKQQITINLPEHPTASFLSRQQSSSKLPPKEREQKQSSQMTMRQQLYQLTSPQENLKLSCRSSSHTKSQKSMLNSYHSLYIHQQSQQKQKEKARFPESSKKSELLESMGQDPISLIQVPGYTDLESKKRQFQQTKPVNQVKQLSQDQRQ